MRTVVYGDFEWDVDKAEANLRKHGIAFEEATTAFLDPSAVDAPDMVHPDRFVLIGRSVKTRILFVVRAERDDRIRIISARKATPVQRRRYEEDR